MGIVVMEGIVITILVLTGLREAIFKAIPLQLKKAIAIGIGFFILFIGLVDGGIVVVGSASSTPVLLGNLIGVPVAVTIFGLVVTIIMLARGWKAAILLGILFSTIFAIILNYAYNKTSVRHRDGRHSPQDLRRARLQHRRPLQLLGASASSASRPPSSGSSASCCPTSSTPWAR